MISLAEMQGFFVYGCFCNADLIQAQNREAGDSGRVWQRISAQAVTFFHSALKKILHSRAERCHGAFRAD